MSLAWNNEKHSIGIPTIDAHHQQFFLLCNHFLEMPQDLLLKERQDRILGGLKQLYSYAKYHFSSEESLFSSYGYSDARSHGGLHLDFTQKVKLWLEAAHEKPNFELAPVCDFLVSWIIFHIQEEDTKYAWEFEKNGHKVEVGAMGPEVERGTEFLDLWNSRKLSLDVEGLDAQHRELIQILQQVNDLSRVSEARQRLLLPDVLRRLFHYTQFHFAFEEQLMAAQRWKGLTEHRVLHKGFVSKLALFGREYKLGLTAVLNDHILLWLRDWTVHHILEEDQKFKNAIHASRTGT